MANDACGNLKVVARNKETLDRIFKILSYNDDEYCLYRCRDVQKNGEPFKDGGFWVQDFFVDGAWSCNPFFNHKDNPNEKLIIGYEKDEQGMDDFDKKIYGTAHFTNLCHIAKILDCGFELYDNEPGCCFWEHFMCNHNGELVCDESGKYDLDYGNNGEPVEEYDIDYYNDFAFSDEIYGNDQLTYQESFDIITSKERKTKNGW